MKISFQQGRDIYESHPGLSLIDKVIRSLGLNKRNVFVEESSRLGYIPYGTIVQAEIFKQCLALTNYADIDKLNRDPMFSELLGCTISPETHRQKLDSLGKIEGIFKNIDDLNFKILQQCNFTTEEYNGKNFIPFDLDVTPFLNPGVHKMGVSRTYKGVDGFSPMMSYLGGYAVCFQLREGTQHSENGTPEYLQDYLDRMKGINVDLQSVLVRADSAHDDEKFLNTCISNQTKFIVKVNPRSETYTDVIRFVKTKRQPEILKNGNKKYYYVALKPPRTGVDRNCLYRVYEIEEVALTDNESLLKFCNVSEDDPNFGRESWIDYHVESYWTNLEIDEVNKIGFDETKIAKMCIESYHNHATSEQYHSEVKTDMNMELLPSKYFSTNALILRLSAISYNILRKISYLAIELDSNLQHHKNRKTLRIRLSTVIDEFCRIPCRIIVHSRRMIVKLSKTYRFFSTFIKMLSLL